MTGPDPALLTALGEALVEQEARQRQVMAGFIADLSDDLTAYVEGRFAELPTVKDGDPGQAGIDRVLTLPRWVGPSDAFERNDVAAFKGGIWQAVRAGLGDPDTDPSGWRCLVPGVFAIETREDWSTRELIFAFRMSDGHLNETRARMLPGLLPIGWVDEGIGVIAGDIIRDGDFEKTALKDGADPANPEDWLSRDTRGRRGRPGEIGKGDPGRPGPGLTGLTLATDPKTGRLAIMPSFEDPEVKAAPILVEMLVDDTGPARRAIVGFAGRHDQAKAYGRGDVVSAAPGALWLSLKPDNKSPLVDGASWERMV